MNIAKKVKQAGLVIALAAVAVSATAQGDRKNGDRGGHRGGMNMERITEALDLTEEQVIQIQALLPSRAARGEDTEGATRADRADADARAARAAELAASLEGILTAEQFAKYQEFVANRQGRGQRDSKADEDEGA